MHFCDACELIRPQIGGEDGKNAARLCRGSWVAGLGRESPVCADRVSIPPYGATAVTLNVTVTDTTSSGYVSVVPEGADGLGVSSLNFTRGQTLSNQVVSGPGSGYVAFDLSAGTADLVADVLGYYTS